MSVAVPLRNPALNKAVQERVKDYITVNHLGAGDPLPPETQLAADLGISRGSMREAIKALQSLGIVEVRHGSGVFVRGFNFDSVLDLLTFGLSFDPTRISDILQIRKWLETAAIGEVCQRIADKDVREIEKVLSDWEEQVRAGAPTADQDRAFHRGLYQVLGNQSLIALIDIFWVVYHSVQATQITKDIHPTTTIQDHRDILDAVRKRDASRARQRIQEHFRGFEDRMRKAVKLASPPARRVKKRKGSKK